MFKTTTIINCMLTSTLLLLQGCAGSSISQQQTPNVTSNPAGAIVYANGLEIGKTPLKRNLFDDFPAGWKGSVYSAQGVLMMEMTGCKDYKLKINDRILSEPIHAELECTEVATAEKTTPVDSPLEGTEARLKKLKDLYQKGLVTKEEYERTRARILSEI